MRARVDKGTPFFRVSSARKGTVFSSFGFIRPEVTSGDPKICTFFSYGQGYLFSDEFFFKNRKFLFFSLEPYVLLAGIFLKFIQVFCSVLGPFFDHFLAFGRFFDFGELFVLPVPPLVLKRNFWMRTEKKSSLTSYRVKKKHVKSAKNGLYAENGIEDIFSATLGTIHGHPTCVYVYQPDSGSCSY